MWLNIGFNLVLPIVILRKGDDWFGSLLGKFFNSTPDSPLVGSNTSFGYFVSYLLWHYGFDKARKWNFFSILGALSALLTGGIGLIPGATYLMFAIKGIRHVCHPWAFNHFDAKNGKAIGSSLSIQS